MTNIITPDSFATSWRDLRSFLPAHVTERYEMTERTWKEHIPLAFPDEDPGEALQQMQQSMLDEAREQVPFAHIPLPPSATLSETWQEASNGTWSRVVFGPRRAIAHLSVGIDGIQKADGSVCWSMFIYADDDPVTPEQAIQFAAAVVEAGTDLERLIHEAASL